MRYLLLLLLFLCMVNVAGCSVAQPTSSGVAACGLNDRANTQDDSMSFAELFELAKGRAWTDEEVEGFQALDQNGKNRMVRQLAAEAGGIRTEDQVGTDGVVYTAFWKD